MLEMFSVAAVFCFFPKVLFGFVDQCIRFCISRPGQAEGSSEATLEYTYHWEVHPLLWSFSEEDRPPVHWHWAPTLRAVINVGLSFEVVCECRLQNKSCFVYVLHLPCEKANLLCCCYSSSEHGSVESPSITSLQSSVTSSGVLWRRPPCVIFRWLVLKMSSKFLHLFCPFSFFMI